VGGACSTYGRNEKCVEIFFSENVKGKNIFEDLSVDERIILKWVLKKYGGIVWTG
jgi:hypothetical protein